MLLKFKKDTVYEGTSYGPGYPERIADVKKPWIATFLAQSRAEPLTDQERDEYLAKKSGKKKAGSTSTPAGQCKGSTKSGSRCKSKAVEGSDFCAQHQDQEEDEGGEEDDDEGEEE